MFPLAIILLSLTSKVLCSQFPDGVEFFDFNALTARMSSLNQPHLDIRKRQSDTGPITFPAACTAECAQIAAAISGCKVWSCICTNTTITNLGICLNCSVDLTGIPAFDQRAQELADLYVSNCRSRGFPVPSQTVGAQSPTTASTRPTGPIFTLRPSSSSTTVPAVSASSNPGGGVTSDIPAKPTGAGTVVMIPIGLLTGVAVVAVLLY